MANNNMQYLAVIGVIVVFVVGFGAGILINSGTATTEDYHLTLVITDNNMFSANNTQPAYFVLADNGTLVSSASIHVPVNRKIDLTIINYDDGNDTVPSAYVPVIGTKNNQMLTVSDDNLNATAGPDNNTIDINSIENTTVTTGNAQWISHTFTVVDTNHLLGSTNSIVLNLPIAPSSTNYAEVTFTTSGQYHWACEVPCGDGAMGTPGWMEGTLIVG